MKIERYLTSQVFSAVIAIILVITFYIVLMVGMAQGIDGFTAQGVLTPLVLIIIAIILLAIFSTVNKIEYKLSKGR